MVNDGIRQKKQFRKSDFSYRLSRSRIGDTILKASWDNAAIPRSLAKGGIPVVIDKSLSYYGRTYHMLLDPLLKEARDNIINLIPEGSKGNL